MAVFAPMPNARVIAAMAVKPGVRSNPRAPYLRSCRQLLDQLANELPTRAIAHTSLAWLDYETAGRLVYPILLLNAAKPKRHPPLWHGRFGGGTHWTRDGRGCRG